MLLVVVVAGRVIIRVELFVILLTGAESYERVYGVEGSEGEAGGEPWKFSFFFC